MLRTPMLAGAKRGNGLNGLICERPDRGGGVDFRTCPSNMGLGDPVAGPCTF